MIIPIFIPHKGCPFDCIYCNQKAISGQIEDIKDTDIRRTIDEHILSSKAGTYIEIGFYGGSFTGIEKELQLRYLGIADEYIRSGKVKSVRLSTRPDYINAEILQYLKKYNVSTVELGVQSLDKEVLEKTCRGHSVNDVITSAHLIKEFGINLGIQTMIGLPGDNEEKSINTARAVVDLKPAVVRIYPTLVIQNTFLEKLFREGKYQPLELDAAVDLCTKLLEIYEGNGINVIRIGLQATDRISEGNDVVAGPFHPAFRQLVQSRVELKRMESQIREKKLEKEKEIAIFVSSGNISDVIGQKRQNIEYLKEHYRFKTIKIIEDKSRNQQISVEKLIRNG